MRTLLGVASACIVSATSSARSPSIAASGSCLSCLKWATHETYLKRYSDCPCRPRLSTTQAGDIDPLSTEKGSTLDAHAAGHPNRFGHQRSTAKGWSIYGAQRGQPGATGGNRWQMGQ